MKKTTTNYSLKIERVENTEDRYYITGKLGSYPIDVVMERDALRHITQILDSGIGTGL